MTRDEGLRQLEVERCRYFEEALAVNTRRTYGTGVRQYLRFCQEIGVSPFPLNERTLQYFVVSLARRVGYQSIRVYLCGVQQESLVHGGLCCSSICTGYIILFGGSRGHRDVPTAAFPGLRFQDLCCVLSYAALGRVILSVMVPCCRLPLLWPFLA